MIILLLLLLLCMVHSHNINESHLKARYILVYIAPIPPKPASVTIPAIRFYYPPKFLEGFPAIAAADMVVFSC